MRTLPLRLAPVDGESLPGYVARYSHTFKLPPGDVIIALGLTDSDTVICAGRYGVTLSPEQLDRAAFATGITIETLQGMLLARYARRAFAAHSNSIDALARVAQAHEVLIRSSKFCPSCLRERGAWLVSWQLGWSAICTRHRVLLARACPACGTVPKDMLRSRWISDHDGPLSDPTRCARRLGQRCVAPISPAPRCRR